MWGRKKRALVEPSYNSKIDALEGIWVPIADEIEGTEAGVWIPYHQHSDEGGGPHDHDLVYQPLGDYAAEDHEHDPQDLTHDHDFEYAGIVHSHPEYEGGGEDTGPHNHEGVYQPVGDYAEAAHDHDTSHDHEGEYQPVGDYSTTDHSHPEYEGQGGDAGPHDHDAVYQPKGSYADAEHEHDAPDLTHDHDGTYAPAHDHPYAASGHEHSDLVERIAKLELDVTLLDVRVRELEPPPPPPPAEGDEYVFTWGSSIRPGGDFSQKINKVDENGEEFGNPESFDTLRYRATLKDGTPYDRTYVVGNVNDYSTFQTYYGRPNVDLDLADGAEVLVTWKKAKLWEDEVLQFTHMKEMDPPFGVCGVDSGVIAKFIRMHKSDLNGNAPMNVAEGKQVVLMGNGVNARIPITGVNIDGDKQYFDLLLAEWGPSIANGVELTVAVV
jgi:hypothetical protein